MALRIFRRKPDETDPNIPPPAAGVDEEGSKTGDGKEGASEGQWRPGGGMTQQVEDDAHGMAGAAPSRPRGGARTTTRPKPTRAKAGKSQKATRSRGPAKRAKKSTGRKAAPKRGKKTAPKRGKAGTKRTR